MQEVEPTELLDEVDMLIKNASDSSENVISMYRDKDLTIEFVSVDGAFFVRRNGVNLYSGDDPAKAAHTFYKSIVDAYDDHRKGVDPSFATLREVLQSRNDHVRGALKQLGHSLLSRSLEDFEFYKDQNIYNLLQKRMDEIESEDFLKSLEDDGYTVKDMGAATALPGPTDIADPYQSVAEINEIRRAGTIQSPKGIRSTRPGHKVSQSQLQQLKDAGITWEEWIVEHPHMLLPDETEDDAIKEREPGDDPYIHKFDNTIAITPAAETVNQGEMQHDRKTAAKSEEKKVSNPVKESSTVDDAIEKLGPVATAALGAVPAAIGAVGSAVGGIASGVGNVLGGAASQAASIQDEDDGTAAQFEMHLEPSAEQTYRDDLKSRGPVKSPTLQEESRAKQGQLNDIKLIRQKIDEGEQLQKILAKAEEFYQNDKEIEQVVIKAYEMMTGGKEEWEEPIDPDQDGRNALATAETEGSQAFSSGAVIDLPEKEKKRTGAQPHAVQGAGSEGVEGGGDGSVAMVTSDDTPLPSDEGLPRTADYNSRLEVVHKEGGGGGAGAGGGGGFGGDGGGGGTAMTSGGSSGSDATHTATYGGGGTPEQYDASLKPKKKSAITSTAVQKEEDDNFGDKGLISVDRNLEKDAEVYGTEAGISQLANPTDPNAGVPRKNRTEVRHQAGDGETTRTKESVDYGESRYMEPHQRPIGDGQSSYVIADRNETYKPQNEEDKNVRNPEHQRVSQRFFDEDDYTMRTTDPAAEQYTNLSMSILSQAAQDLQSPFIKSTDTLESLGTSDAFKVLNENAINKMDLGRSLVVAGWGNYYVVDQEGHRISLGGMQRAIKRFMANPEYANMNIFHSGIQVGQILEKFVDKDGRIWTTEVRPEGLFVVAAFRTDLEVAVKAMSEVMKGNMRGFSIAGNAKKKEIKCDHGKCWTEVTELDIYEVTLCVSPMNQKSYITDIVQKPDPETCPDCYVGDHMEYDSNLQLRI
ncbi:hypothetical protein CMI37_06125 [Candidatus Pacearchaeota archaeon]|nr:hypothetical protein [Candidatus Pacearchaeota archaeon]